MKRVLIISTGIIATIWASGTFAQTMPTAAAEAPSSDVPQGDGQKEIVVTGIRQALSAAM
jgi:hypothetical protein